METDRHNKMDPEKLVHNDDSVSLETPTPKGRIKTVTNAAPYIRKHELKGRTYYTYRRGIDKEIYLGTADAILRAVKGDGRRDDC